MLFSNTSPTLLTSVQCSSRTLLFNTSLQHSCPMPLYNTLLHHLSLSASALNVYYTAQSIRLDAKHKNNTAIEHHSTKPATPTTVHRASMNLHIYQAKVHVQKHGPATVSSRCTAPHAHETQPLSLNLLAPGAMAHFKERRNHGTRHEIRHKSEFRQILKEQRWRLTKVVFQARKCHRIYTLQHTPNTQITLPLT